MLLLPVLVCFSPLLLSSFPARVSAARPKPVELKFSCMAVKPEEHEDQRPDDIPIISIHGIAGSKESLRVIFEYLALETKRKHCIVDLRNHGESPWNSDEYDVATMTEDIKHFMDQLNVTKAIIYGQSFGGKMALHLALTYPGRVEKVIVEDMRPNGLTPEAYAAGQAYLGTLKEVEKDLPQGVTTTEAKKAVIKLRNERLEKINPSLKSNDSSFIPVKCSDGKCQWTTNAVILDSFLRDYNEIWSESSGQFDGPALFIYGGKSPFRVGDDEGNIKRLFPNATLVEVAEGDHILNRSKKFKEEVIKFINN